MGDSIFPLSSGGFGHYVLLWTADFWAFFASFFAMLIVILSRDKGLELLEHESGIVQSPLKFEAQPRFKTVFEITFDENGNQYIQ